MKIKSIAILLFLILLMPNLFALVSDANMKIFAVSGETSAKDAQLNVKIVPGTGKIYSSIDESIVGSSTQESFKNAIAVADSVIKEDIKHKYDFTVDITSNAHTIDGPSAGGAMALLIISMFKDSPVPENVSMTGSISIDGYIGDVGGIYYKAKKASEIGIDLFFIPQGNRSQVINEDDEIKQVDLIEHAYNEWNLKIIEVSTIEDVLDYAFRDVSSIDINSIQEEKVDDFVYNKIEYSKAVEPLKKITEEYILNTEEKLSSINSKISSSNIKDLDVLDTLLSTVTYSEELVENSKKFYENNYFYSAANNSFLAYINIISVEEIITNPSILADSSIIFDLRVSELDEKITLTENRSNNCSIEYLEWCVGGRQRITWARDKVESLKEKQTTNNFSKIQEYAYALAWTEIANDFLDASITTNNDLKFVESNFFKEKAQESIISVENQLILVAPNIADTEDLKRRLNAAKINYQRGWYVTSLYDSATALAVIKTQEDSKNNFTLNDFNIKYDQLTKDLRNQSAMNNENYVWSKTFLDHGIYYKNAHDFYKNKDEEKAKSQLNVANSILNFAHYLYETEKIVLDYYLNTDLETLVIDISSSNKGSVIIVSDEDENISKEKETSSQNIYIYSKEKKDVYLYLFVAALFLMVLTIVFEVERFKKHHSKEGIIKQIGYLDEKLIEGKISPFTYKEMRDKYLLELERIKNKDVLKDSKSKMVYDTSSVDFEKKIIDKQIFELEKRKKLLSENEKSDSIKSVKKIVSKIKPSKKKEEVKPKEVSKSKTSKKKPKLKKDL